jgi:hypothetical protein
MAKRSVSSKKNVILENKKTNYLKRYAQIFVKVWQFTQKKHVIFSITSSRHIMILFWKGAKILL